MRRWRLTPAEKERRRRLALDKHGRMTDGMLTEQHGDYLCYSYSVRGVGYAASQDVSTLRDLLPEDPSTLIGPVTIKYSARNPANSIVLCEHWSGFRRRSRIVAKGA